MPTANDVGSQVTLGTLAIVMSDRRVLLVRSAHRPERWSLPGGFVEEGESLVDAMAREVKEEVGRRATRLRLAGICHSAYENNLAVVFECELDPDSSVTPGRPEVEEVGYFPEEELPPVSGRTLAILRAFGRRTEGPFVVHARTPDGVQTVLPAIGG